MPTGLLRRYRQLRRHRRRSAPQYRRRGHLRRASRRFGSREIVERRIARLVARRPSNRFLPRRRLEPSTRSTSESAGRTTGDQEVKQALVGTTNSSVPVRDTSRRLPVGHDGAATRSSSSARYPSCGEHEPVTASSVPLVSECAGSLGHGMKHSTWRSGM